MTDRQILEHIKERYVYDKRGRLNWKTSSPFRKAGQEAGWKVTGRPYRQVTLGRKHLGVHRAIFLYHYGFLPPVVDHINGDSDDNRIENLRSSDASKNAKNRKVQTNNKTGFSGVHYAEKDQKWRASIRVNYKYINLGTYDNLEDAVQARQDAELHYYGELARKKSHD